MQPVNALFAVFAVLLSSSALGSDEVAELVESAAAEVQAISPRDIDDETRLDGARADGYRLIYDYTFINYAAGELDGDEVNQLLAPRLKIGTCSMPDSVEMLNKGVTVIFDYKTNDGTEVTEVAVDAQDCVDLALDETQLLQQNN